MMMKGLLLLVLCTIFVHGNNLMVDFEALISDSKRQSYATSPCTQTDAGILLGALGSFQTACGTELNGYDATGEQEYSDACCDAISALFDAVDETSEACQDYLETEPTFQAAKKAYDDSNCKKVSCFALDSKVVVPGGASKTIGDIKVGDKVLSFDLKTKKAKFSPVTAILDKVSETKSVDFVVLTTASGKTLTITEDHTMFVHGAKDSVFAGKVQVGDFVVLADGSKDKVVSKHTVAQNGAITPLTAQGTIVVEGVVASCYAKVSHKVGQMAMAPLRWFQTNNREGLHWYAKTLKNVFAWAM